MCRICNQYAEMDIQDVVKVVNAEVVNTSSETSLQVDRGFASDLMSDVLTINTDNLLLLTGLNNLQTIRTAEMAEIKAVLFARNKRPTPEMIELANQENIVLLLSEKSMYHVSGLLFAAGLKPVF